MGWSDKYKKSIDCNNPKGFSQRAHCQGRKKKMNEEKGNGRCKPGHYYCYTNKECRPIPAGFMVDPQGMLRKENGHTVDEGTLHKWFKGSKSKDGKGGWVNVVTGGTCASDKPGEGTPKCVSSAKRASMSKSERLSAARRKKKADPGQQQKTGAAKPTYVATDKKKKVSESVMRDKQGLDKFDRSKRMIRHMQDKYGSAKSGFGPDSKFRTGKDHSVANEKKMKEKVNESSETMQAKVAKLRERQRAKLDAAKRAGESSRAQIAKQQQKAAEKETMKQEIKRELTTEGKDRKGKGSGTKDACYHKVKSRYSVWPSAYASGALVKCRKVGAANWGNSTKKESYDFSNWRDEFKALEIETVDLIKPEPLLSEKKDCMHNHKGEECPVHGKKECPSTEIEEGKYSSGSVTYVKGTAPVRDPQTGESYPKETYKKKSKKVKVDEKYQGMYQSPAPTHNRLMSSDEKARMSPGRRAIAKSDELEKSEPGSKRAKAQKKAASQMARNFQSARATKEEVETIDEAGKKCWKGYKKAGTQKLFGKTYNRCVKAHFSDWRADLELQEGAAWTKKSGKNEKGGLNEKGRKSYERENPGSDLKRPSKEVGNKRRASFCARMKGMKKKLTSKKTANDPDSRINKSLRAWNC